MSFVGSISQSNLCLDGYGGGRSVVVDGEENLRQLLFVLLHSPSSIEMPLQLLNQALQIYLIRPHKTVAALLHFRNPLSKSASLYQYPVFVTMDDGLLFPSPSSPESSSQLRRRRHRRFADPSPN
nr:hypothetical protein Iba_chr05cCG11880 [Ipomoea batatas]